MILIKVLHSFFCQKKQPCDIVHLTAEADFVSFELRYIFRKFSYEKEECQTQEKAHETHQKID